MLGRILWKCVLVLSLALAITLAILWLRTRTSDLIISGARHGTYREVRFAHGQVGVMMIPRWPIDERTRIGRPAAPTDLAAHIITRGPSPGPTMSFLDGTTFTLMPTGSTALTSRGTLLFNGLPKKHLVPATTMPAGAGVGFFNTMKRPWRSAPGTPQPTMTMSGTSTLTITMPATMPTTTATLSGTGMTVKTSSNGAVIAGFQSGSGTLAFSVARPPTTAPAASFSGATDTGTIFLLPTYNYDRYAAPLWALIVLALLPVWISFVVAFAKRMRRLSRRSKGLCESCGYDLRGNPNNACPECGAPGSVVTAIPADVLRARLQG